MKENRGKWRKYDRTEDTDDDSEQSHNTKRAISASSVPACGMITPGGEVADVLWE
jgi:hypothetical protein